MWSGPSPSAEVPQLMTAYAESYRSYTDSLADVEARLSSLAAREAAIRTRIDNATQSFAFVEAQWREDREDLHAHLRSTHRRLVSAHDRLSALQRRREKLSSVSANQQAMAEEEAALETQETYWCDLLRQHRAALAAMSRRAEAPRQPLSPSPSPSAPAAAAARIADGRREEGEGTAPVVSLSGRHAGLSPHPPPPRQPSATPRPLSLCWSDAVGAARAGEAARLSALVRASPELLRCADGEGNTLLHLACAVEPPSLAVVRCLLEGGAALTAFNRDGLTAFHVACLNLKDRGHTVLDTLIAAGAAVEQPTEFGETAAHLLASHDAFLPSLAHLVEHHGADVSVRATVGGQLRTPLEVAECYGESQTGAVCAFLRSLGPQ